MDAREEKKAATPVTATFRGDVDLVTATALLADMAGLTVRQVDNVLYVTSPARDAPLPDLKPKKVQPAPTTW